MTTRTTFHWLNAAQAAVQRDPAPEGGFTLIELLIVLVILPMIIGAVAIVMITTLKATDSHDPEGTAARLVDSHDAQISSAYFVRDVQSAEYISTNSSPLCAPPEASFASPAAWSQQLIGLEWKSGANQIDVSYFVLQASSELVRFYCVNGVLSNGGTSVISHDVFLGATSPGLVACSGIGVGATTCAGDTDPTTYVALTVNCRNGPPTCTNAGLYPVYGSYDSGSASSGSETWSAKFSNAADDFTSADVGQPISGAFIPSGTTVGGPISTPTSTVTLSQPATGFGSGLSFTLTNRGVKSVNLAVHESKSGFGYALSAIPRRTNGTAGATSSVPFNPPFISNGPVQIGNCNFIVNGIAALNNGATVTGKNNGSFTSTGTYTAGVASPYSVLTEPPASPPGNPYPVYTIPANITNWDPSTDPTYWANGQQGVMKQGIYIVQAGMSVSKGLTTPQGALFYIKSGSVTLGGNGNINISDLSPYWESPATVPPPPMPPEPVLWISRGDTSPNPPSLTLNGNGNAIALNGAIYAPTANVTINGGGQTGGINVAGMDVGSFGTSQNGGCNGGGSTPINVVAGAPLASGTVDVAMSPNITLTKTNQDSITVQGVGTAPPLGNVIVYVCGPYASASTCTSSTLNVHTVGTVALTQGLNGSSSATSQPFTFSQLGTWCFAAYYQGYSGSGGVQYLPSSDTTSDGCFTVGTPLGPPPPTFTYPSLGCYSSKSPPAGCTVWAGSITGGATDPTGSVTSISLQIQGPDNAYWNGTKWQSAAFTFTLAPSGGGPWTWSYPFSSFESGKSGQGDYTLTATSTDAQGTSLPATLTFTWDG